MNARLERFINHPSTKPTLIGVTAFAGGLALGYILGKRIKELEVESKADEEEIEQIKLEVEELLFEEKIIEEKEVIYFDEDNPQYQAMLRERQAIKDAIEYENRPDPADIEVDEPTLEHIRDIVNRGLTPTHWDYDPNNLPPVPNPDEGWDYEEEIANRTEEKPYVIHRDEFWAEEMDFDQSTLTYYPGDDILTDQEDQPVYNYKDVVGDLKFGHGSGDSNVFHVRNHRHMAEYEVIRTDGSYSELVLGLIAEEDLDPENIKHSLRRARFGLED